MDHCQLPGEHTQFTTPAVTQMKAREAISKVPNGQAEPRGGRSPYGLFRGPEHPLYKAYWFLKGTGLGSQATTDL